MNHYAQIERQQQQQPTYPCDTVTITRDVSLILIERQGMTSMYDLAGRTFLAVARTNVPVLLISQSSAQGNFCFAVPHDSAACVLEAVSVELAPEIARRHVIAVRAVEKVAIVTARINGCGAGFSLCDKLAAAGINILVCTQGASSVSAVIAAVDARRAIRAWDTPVYAARRF